MIFDKISLYVFSIFAINHHFDGVWLDLEVTMVISMKFCIDSYGQILKLMIFFCPWPWPWPWAMAMAMAMAHGHGPWPWPWPWPYGQGHGLAMAQEAQTVKHDYF